VAACFAEVFRLYEQGKVKPAAATAFPLARADEALAALRERRIAGRAVLHLRDD
jgi:D-arabinose 1-dehydrogenase-like Zn-dependent alcohol dehydrogenase